MIFTVYINYCTCKYTLKVQNYEFTTLKFAPLNEGESNRKLPKKFTGKNLQMTQNQLHELINQRKAWHGEFKIDPCAVTKHKIILLWP